LTLIIGSLLCVGILAFSPSDVRASERAKVLCITAQYFGDPIDNDLLLFEVDRDHVLRLSFDRKDNLVQLSVEPKYYFADEHPEWQEKPTFTNFYWIEFQDLLAKLEFIKAKGILVRPASEVSIVTNLTAWETSYYEKAALTIGRLVDMRLPAASHEQIRWFRLEYGKVGRKARP
jgi:hypothetical protein